MYINTYMRLCFISYVVCMYIYIYTHINVTNITNTMINNTNTDDDTHNYIRPSSMMVALCGRHSQVGSLAGTAHLLNDNAAAGTVCHMYIYIYIHTYTHIDVYI